MIVLKLVAGDRNIFFPRYFSNFYTFFKDRKKSAYTMLIILYKIHCLFLCNPTKFNVIYIFVI